MSTSSPTAKAPATTRQVEKLRQLVLSTEFTAAESENTYTWLDSGKATTETASIMIDKCLARLQARKEREERENQPPTAEEPEGDFYGAYNGDNEEGEPYMKVVNGKTFHDPVEAAAEASSVLFGD